MECISGLERFAWFRSALTHGHSGFEPLRNPLALLKVRVQVATSHGILRASCGFDAEFALRMGIRQSCERTRIMEIMFKAFNFRVNLS